MSDLIDFDSSPICPSGKSSRSLLASPLIPGPADPEHDGARREPSEPSSGERRASLENNPFDLAMKRATEYERNREDPFEGLLARTADRPDFNRSGILPESCDCCNGSFKKASVPGISVSPAADLSILNSSAMNDSLLAGEAPESEQTETARPDGVRCSSDSDCLPVAGLSMQRPPPALLTRERAKRSVSVSDSLRNSAFGDSNSLSFSCRSGDDPLNNAFRKSNLLSSDSSGLLCARASRDEFECLNSNSSVFSGLSNISAIPMEYSSNRARQERFFSDSSVAGLSNVSIIPSSISSLPSSTDLSLFSNSTINKAFIGSRSQLDSGNFSNAAENNISRKANDKSDLIQKFYEIKKRMSCQGELANNEDSKEWLKDERGSPSKTDKEDCAQNSAEKLVDINSSSNSVFSDPDVNNIIANEANTLAETFEKLASSKQSTSAITDDELLFSKAELNFDDLPPSDDEAVENLIDLPISPEKDVNIKKVEQINAKKNESPVNNDSKALESEFIDETDCNKKAVATALILDLQKIINKEDNPGACKVLDDLQKILGVKCDNNTEILKNCLRNTDYFLQNGNQVEFEQCPTENNTDCKKDNVQSSNNQNETSPSVIISNHNCTDDKLKLNIDDEEKKTNEKSDSKLNSETETSSEMEPQDQKLAENLLSALNKIVHKNDENNVVDFLSNLGSILSMATELRTKNKEIFMPQSEKKVISRSSMSSFTSKSVDENSQFKPLEAPSRHRNSLLNRSLNLNNSATLLAKEKKKSPLLDSRRFPSDQSLFNKKRIESFALENKKSHLLTSNVASESIKAKFKKKPCTEVVTKRGPLKAMIPLGSMQKQASRASLMSSQVTLTPPKAVSVPLNIPSSTPNSSRSSRISKSNPKASSTPNVEGSRRLGEVVERRPVNNMRKNFKSSSTGNLSSLNSSLRRSDSLKTSKRLDRTLSPQKKVATPSKHAENGTESRLPRYSPRPVRVRNYSFNDLRTASNYKSPPKLSPKISSEQKFKRHSVLSPLRNLNKQQRPTSLISNLGRSRIQTGPEKENYM